MNARMTLFAMFAFGGSCRQRLRPGLDLGGNLYEDPVTTTTVTTYSPASQPVYAPAPQPAPVPSNAVEANYVDPTYGEPINLHGRTTQAADLRWACIRSSRLTSSR